MHWSAFLGTSGIHWKLSVSTWLAFRIVQYSRKYLIIDKRVTGKSGISYTCLLIQRASCLTFFDFVSWWLVYLSQMLIRRDCSLP